MTRLFLRFYLSVTLTAVLAFVAVSALLLESTRAHDERVVEDTLHGGAMLLAQSLRALPPAERAFALRAHEATFRHPLALIPWASPRVPTAAKVRLSGARGIALFYDDEVAPFVAVPLVRNQQLLVLGPLPDFALPSPVPMLSALALVMLLSAVSVSIALRPLRRVLQTLDHAAERLADGDLTARASTGDLASLPFARALDRMANEIERLVQGQRELLRMVSHELRTPMARLRFALELLAQAPDDAARGDQLREIEADLDGLEALVDELLTYARLEHASPQLERRDLSVADALEALASEARDSGKALEIVPVPAELTVHGDARLFQRALGNLTRNALRHARAQVRISAERVGAMVLIHVDDDGAGIAATDRERVFAPFVRLEDGGQGTGLGLAIVRRICTWHGGRVHIGAAPSGGARVTSEWPASEA